MRVTTPSAVGAGLRDKRKRLGLSQTQAGATVQLTQAAVSGLENGSRDVRLDTLFRYCSALGLDISLSDRPQAANSAEDWE